MCRGDLNQIQLLLMLSDLSGNRPARQTVQFDPTGESVSCWAGLNPAIRWDFSRWISTALIARRGNSIRCEAHSSRLEVCAGPYQKYVSK